MMSSIILELPLILGSLALQAPDAPPVSRAQTCGVKPAAGQVADCCVYSATWSSSAPRPLDLAEVHSAFALQEGSRDVTVR